MELLTRLSLKKRLRSSNKSLMAVTPKTKSNGNLKIDKNKVNLNSFSEIGIIYYTVMGDPLFKSLRARNETKLNFIGNC